MKFSTFQELIYCWKIPARLDGVSESARRKMSEHKSIEDWLELSDFRESNPLDEKGKKRVRTNVKGEIGQGILKGEVSLYH
jgi:hypothetical protein